MRIRVRLIFVYSILHTAKYIKRQILRLFPLILIFILQRNSQLLFPFDQFHVAVEDAALFFELLGVEGER